MAMHLFEEIRRVVQVLSRRTVTATMRPSGVHPKVISSILGHSGVELAMNS